MITRCPQFIRSASLFSILGWMAVILSGCQTMGPTEHGVRFRRLPPFIGGGVASAVVPPGKTVMVMPGIDTIYRFSTAVQDISYGSQGAGQQAPDDESGFVYTRARDGNEVAIAMTIVYKLQTDPNMLTKLISEVAVSDQEVRELVSSVARAEIRRALNRLRTFEFLEQDLRYAAVDEVAAGIQARVGQYGITVVRVKLDESRFERQTENGPDRTYQDKLREIQQRVEETQRERERIATVRAKRDREKNDMVALTNRLAQEAIGFRDQAKVRGDSYLTAKTNESEGILAKGTSEAQGLVEKAKAVSGPGGEAVLRLELARALAASNPKFIVLGNSGSGSVDIKSTDVNQLMVSLGLADQLKRGIAEIKSAKEKAPTTSDGRTENAPEDVAADEITKQKDNSKRNSN